jgi:hypothetical protein
MSQTTVNPYEEIGAQVQAGLAAIASTLTGGYTIDDLVNAVFTYVESVYWPGGVSTQIEIEIKAIQSMNKAHLLLSLVGPLLQRRL